MTTKQKRRTAIGLIVAVAMAVLVYSALPDLLAGSLRGLKANDSLTLYSLDGRSFPPGKEPQTAEKFHDVPVLGKIEIADAKSRKQIVSELKWGVVNSEWFSHKFCFWPRHGIRATANGKTVDIVICFECDRVIVYGDGDLTSEQIGDSPRELLNQLLTDANIPIAPEGGIGH